VPKPLATTCRKKLLEELRYPNSVSQHPRSNRDIDELKAFLADKLAKYEMPTEMVIHSSLPKTPVGKLSKKELLAEEIAMRQAADALPVSRPEVA
jgi:non-ribosomal peptide synthetase component E (peptide arylation enzyme)